MQGIKRFGQRGFLPGDTDKVNMIRHEAIGPDLKTIFVAVYLKPMKILLKVIIIVENRILIVATLGYMMGIIKGYGSRYSWHGLIIAKHFNKSRKRSLSLFFSLVLSKIVCQAENLNSLSEKEQLKVDPVSLTVQD